MRVVHKPNSRYEAGKWEVREGRNTVMCRCKFPEDAEAYIQTAMRLRTETAYLVSIGAIPEAFI